MQKGNALSLKSFVSGPELFTVTVIWHRMMMGEKGCTTIMCILIDAEE
jgi:hypothetical protein